MNNDKYFIIALFGKSASGKDTIQNWIVSNYPATHKIVSCTTRPKREHEEEGKDYFFLSRNEFAQKIYNGDMLEATEFRDWFYGTPIQGLDKTKINIGVFNPEGIQLISEDNRTIVIPIYITASDKTRLLRSLNREDNPDCAEICRRFGTDEKDFIKEKLPETYLEYENNGLVLDEDDLRAFMDNILQ